MLLARYILGMAWPRTLFISLLGVVLYTVLDSMEAARWLSHGTVGQVVVYYACRAPEVVQQMLGPAVVLGLLATLGLLNRRAELTCMGAAGRPLTHTVLPAAMLLSGGCAIAHAALSQWVVPRTGAVALDLAMNTFALRGGRYGDFYWRPEWFKAGRMFARAQPRGNRRYENVVAVTMDADGRVTQRFVATGMEAEDDRVFVLEHAAIHGLGNPRTFEAADHKRVEMPQAAAALSAPMGYPELYTLKALRRVVALREAGGRDTGAYRLALMRRYSDPLMVLMLGVLAVPLAARQRREATVERLLFVGGLAVGAAQVMMMASDILASRDVVPPWLAAGSAPVAVALAALLLWLRAESAKTSR